MLPCGIYEERFSSNGDLEGHKSQMLQESEIKNEQDSDQDPDPERSLVFVCVKEEAEIKKEETFEEFNFAPVKVEEENRTLHERESSSGTFMCSKCPYKTMSKRYFQRHMSEMHFNKYKCDQCPKRFTSKGFLANHIREKHVKDTLPEEEFYCVKMKVQGNRKRRFYECLKCRREIRERQDMLQHIHSVHGDLLDEAYKSKGLVNDDAGYHKCTKCLYKTVYLPLLKQHIAIVHQKRREFVCDLCKKAFSAKRNLIRHLKCIHVPIESSDLHKCSACSFKTTYKQALKSHLIAVHFNIREFTCDLCQKQFSAKQVLRKHVEGVHLKKKLTRPTCRLGESSQRKLSFVSKDDGSKRERGSDQDSAEECLVLDCVKEEEQLQDQQGVKDYEELSLAPSDARDECRTLPESKSSSETFRCSKCSFKTISKAYFKKHMNLLHLNKFKCEQCPKRYPSKDRLANHTRVKHVKDEDKPKLPEDEFFRIIKINQGKKRIFECLKCTLKTRKRWLIYCHIGSVHRQLLDELYESKGLVKDETGYEPYIQEEIPNGKDRSVAGEERPTLPDRHSKKIVLSCNRGSNCSFRTTEQQELLRHVQQVHEEIPSLSCEICGKSYSSPAGLYFHKKTQHLTKEEPSTPTRVPCPLCQSTGHSIFGCTC